MFVVNTQTPGGERIRIGALSESTPTAPPPPPPPKLPRAPTRRSPAPRSSTRPADTVRTVKTGTRLSLKRPEGDADINDEFERIVVWDSGRLFSALMVFGMMLVCKFYTRGAVRSGVTEGLTEAAVVRQRRNLRETPGRQQREERQANTPPVRLADMHKVFGRDVRLAIRQILRALVPEAVIRDDGRVVDPYRPVAAVQAFLAEDETRDFIDGVGAFFDAIPPQDGRPGLAAIGVLPHWPELLTDAAKKITGAFENNLAHPFTGRVEDVLNTITRDKAQVQYAVHVGLGTKRPPKNRPLLSVAVLTLMEDILRSMDWGGRLMRVTARKQFTEALFRVEQEILQDDPRAVAVIEAMMEAVFEDAARDRAAGAAGGAAGGARGRPAGGAAAGAAPAARGRAPDAAAGADLAAAYPDAADVPARMQPVWKQVKRDLEMTTGILDAPVLSAEKIKSDRIFSSLDTHVMMLQRMVDHDVAVDGREHQREVLRQLAVFSGRLDDPQDLDRMYPHLVEDAVMDTKASKFTIAPIGQDDGEMHMYGAPLGRIGLFMILRHLGRLPDAIDPRADFETQGRQFTTRIAAQEMARWISPVREGQQPASPSLVVGAYCEVNPVTACFNKVPPAGLDAAGQRELRRNDAASNHSASYKRWLKREAMQSTLTPQDLWLDGNIMQPHPNALEREHFLSPRDFAANPEEAAHQRAMFDNLLYEMYEIDPGIHNTVTTVRLRDGLVHSMTLKQYYYHAKIDERIRKMTGWLRRDENVVAFRAARGTLTFKTTSAAEHDMLLRVFVEHIATIRYVAELDAPVFQPLGFDSVDSATIPAPERSLVLALVRSPGIGCGIRSVSGEPVKTSTSTFIPRRPSASTGPSFSPSAEASRQCVSTATASLAAATSSASGPSPSANGPRNALR